MFCCPFSLFTLTTQVITTGTSSDLSRKVWVTAYKGDLLSCQSLTFVMFLHLNSESRWATQNGVRILSRYLRDVYALQNVFLT